MAIWVALILGAIQGITEFLPLSSSGHLLLAEHFLGAPTSMFFNLLMHLATLIAVILFFWKDVVYCIKHPFSRGSLCLVLSTFCTAAIAFAVYCLPGALDGVALGPSFLVTGCILIFTEILEKKKANKPIKPMTSTKAFTVGIAQGLATLPGISRSGTTISTLRAMGVESQEATSYSFLLSVPIIIGGIILELLKGTPATQTIGVWPCLVGFIFAFLFGLLSLFILKKLIKNNKWWIFAPYLLVLGVLVTIWQYL